MLAYNIRKRLEKRKEALQQELADIDKVLNSEEVKIFEKLVRRLDKDEPKLAVVNDGK